MKSSTCNAVLENGSAYVEHTLPTGEMRSIDAHLIECEFCREALAQYNAVENLLQFVRASSKAEAAEKKPQEASLVDRFGGAPWWAVSLLLHVLVILLAGLISMAIELPATNESVVMVTELAERKELNLEPEKPKDRPESALASKHDTPPTDPTSKVASDIVVPPDILAKAEIGDHFETINPDRPDTQSAFGNPDAHMFHSVRGNDEPPGGGGVGGTGLDELIGVGGSGSLGTGGGWGGGNGTGTGVDSGSGHGSFGNRNGGGRKLMVMRHGGSRATEDAVDLALQWLAYHQEPDGSWLIDKHGGNGKLKDTCVVGVTALGVLAFLGAGHTEKVGKYKENVQRGVAYLISKQDPTGCIGENNTANGWITGSGYNHPIAGMALAEAWGMAHIPATGQAAKLAVKYTSDLHWDANKYTWNYARTKRGSPAFDENISVVAWFVMQLKSAKVAGIDVSSTLFMGTHDWLDKLMPEKKDGAYADHRYGYTATHKKPTPANTSMGVLCRLFMGVPTQELESGADFMLTEVPQWNDKNGTTSAARGPCPHYYWYYGSLVMFQMGGNHWTQWNEALKSTLIPNQRKDGDFAGSWDCLGNDGPYAGRAYTTALGALSMEVYYRYAKLH